MYKYDLALNNLQWLICHKIQPTNNYPTHTKKKKNTLTFSEEIYKLFLNHNVVKLKGG